MQGKKVLIIEDDFFMSDMYRTKFSGEGFEVFVANDGVQAREKLRHGLVPDIILLDLIMPNMDGKEFLLEMRNFPNLSLVPILILSNLSQQEDIAESFSLGAKDYIIKSKLTPSEVFEKAIKFLEEPKV